MSRYPAEKPIVISTYLHDDGTKRFFGFSDTEARRAAHMWERVLSVAGIERGEPVVVISAPEDAHLAMPLEAALEMAGIIILQAEATTFEGMRIEAFIRNFDPVALFGLRKATLEGLTMLGQDVSRLLSGRAIWAYDDALPALRRLDGITLRRWSNLGPAVLISCGHHATAMHLDSIEWDLVLNGDRATLSHRMGAAEPDAVTLDASGIHILREPCRCGMTDMLIETALNRSAPQ